MLSDELTRRSFLAGSAALAFAAAGCAGGDGPAKALGVHPAPGVAAGSGGRVPPPLVLVTLAGGNDALNTVIPVEDGRYHDLRAGLAVDASAAPVLGDGYALHPALARSKELWDGGHLAVVHGVGFEGLDRSHFHCMDVWHAGGGEAGDTGWIGRWLDISGGGPLDAVVVDTRLPLLARGAASSAAVVPPGPFALAAEGDVLGAYAAMVASDGERHPLEALVARSGTDLLAVADAVAGPLASAPAGETLGERLAMVATLMEAGLPARVYAVELRGFDTHAGQAGTHQSLLAELDGAVGDFLATVGPDGATVAIYSEFGRRVAPNGSDGTDHGRAGTVLLAGRVRPGHHGDPPLLDDLVGGDLRTTTPVTAVYGALLEGVLATPAADVLDRPAAPLALVP